MADVRDRETSCFTSLCTYDVFLSFRGADTRKTFTDHLYTALVGVGFRTFRDDNEIERGENINSELEKAILQSRSSIIIISRNYASSRWCLDELVLILEQRRAKGHAILPIFYHVDPSKVRMQMGTFGKALSKHEKRFEEEADDKKKLLMDRVKVWRSALKEVADMGGMVLRKYDDGSELKFIQKIVNVIEDKVNRTILSIAPYLIGINSRAKNINLWLQNQSNDVNILAICGMGGIGKTTVAKYVFSLNFENFECSSFLSSVRETSRQPDGLIRLQRKLLSDILKGKKKKIGSLDEGAMMIKDAIYCKKVLIIFDDVDQMDQLDAILGTRGWFNPGSKIIITTRQKELLKAHEVCKVHEVDKLSSRESLELFSWHAFGQDHPLKHYTDISEMVVHHCGGLPLALQVLGSSLSGKTLEVWESALEKLKAIPESQILQKLKISYNSLQDDHDKNLFLDIACFFVGKDIDYIITILDGCGFFAKIGVDNLIGRYLVSVDQYNKLMMHQSLQDMGREIIRQESKKEPGKRSRVWHLKDASNVLGEKTGTETIEGLSLNFHASYGNKLFESCSNAFKSKRHRSEDLLDRAALLIEGISFKRRCLGFLSWLPIDSAIIRPFSRAHEIDLDTAAFSRMQRLRLLQLSNVRLNGGYEEFPKKLRWLCWRGFPLRTIPFDFPAENLVVLDMRNSSLVQVWKGTKVLRSLKIINLSHSHGLTITPNFLELPNLERLILKDCINLLEVHESIEILGRLVLLNLKGCKNLRKLPRRFSQLKSLETLILSGCSMLDELPMELGEMESLSVLCADGTTISGLPSITSHSKNVLSASAKLVNSLFWSWVSPTKNPKSTSFSLAKLPSCLTKLDLENCQLTDDIMPVDLSKMSSLQYLNIGGSPISILPESIKDLTVLKTLILRSCPRLLSVPELPLSLEWFEASECTSLVRMKNIPNCETSTEYHLQGCNNLVEVQNLFKLEPLVNFDAKMIDDLGVIDLESMQDVEVELVNQLTETRKRGPIQGLYEFGIFSTFFPGSKVPDCFSIKSTGQGALSFAVPSLVNAKIRGLCFSIVYAHDADYDWQSPNFWFQSMESFLCVRNMTKDVEWKYSPTFIGRPRPDQYMVWLSHWYFRNKFEAGDEVEVEFYSESDFNTEEVGVLLFYEKLNDNEIQSASSEIVQYSTYASSQKPFDADFEAHKREKRVYWITSQWVAR